MVEFIWIDYNRGKIDHHALSTDEVEFAWCKRQDFARGVDPKHGPYTESFGQCPSGRLIRIVWRYDEDIDGEMKVFIINAYGGGK